MSDHSENGAAGSTTVAVQYPSREFPPPPAFAAQVPDDWRAVPVPDAEMVVRSPRGHRDFHANAMVRARRVAPVPTDPVEYLNSVIRTEIESSEYDVESIELLDHEELPALTAQVRTTNSDGLDIGALQLHIYVPTTDIVSYVLSVTGTAAIDGDPGELAAVKTMITSLRVHVPSSP